jgi:hypothetical protein
MKVKVTHIIVTMALVMGIAARSGFAQGLLGERYISFSVGKTNPGDGTLSNFDNSIFRVGGGLNVPVTSNIDTGFGFSYSKISGNHLGMTLKGTGKSYSGYILYHFMPDRKFNPYVGISAGIVTLDAKYGTNFGLEVTEHNDDFASRIFSGLEVSLSKLLAVTPFTAYQRVGDFDDIFTGIELTWWFNEFLFGTLFASYALDEGDFSYSGGLGIGF